MPTTRPATPADAAEMVELLNEIIEIGGTTAYEELFDLSAMDHQYISAPDRIACTVAEENGEIVGFQGLFWPNDASGPLPDGWAHVATFSRIGHAGGGVGRALFAATRSAARAAGVKTIDTTIRADNTAGLAYYARLGFSEYARLEAVPLRGGSPVERIRKRLDL